jgi:hypothetical protein
MISHSGPQSAKESQYPKGKQISRLLAALEWCHEGLTASEKVIAALMPATSSRNEHG